MGMHAVQLRKIIQRVFPALALGSLAVLVPISGTQDGPKSIPENYENLINPGLQGVIIQDNVPWPAVVPVPPPVPTPVRGESSQRR